MQKAFYMDRSAEHKKPQTHEVLLQVVTTIPPFERQQVDPLHQTNPTLAMKTAREWQLGVASSPELSLDGLSQDFYLESTWDGHQNAYSKHHSAGPSNLHRDLLEHGDLHSFLYDLHLPATQNTQPRWSQSKRLSRLTWEKRLREHGPRWAGKP